MYRIRSKAIAKRRGSLRRGAWVQRRSPSELSAVTTGVALLLTALVLSSGSAGAVAASPANPAAHYVTLSGSPGMPELDPANDTIYVPTSAPRATARAMHPVEPSTSWTRRPVTQRVGRAVTWWRPPPGTTRSVPWSTRRQTPCT